MEGKWVPADPAVSLDQALAQARDSLRTFQFREFILLFELTILSLVTKSVFLFHPLEAGALQGIVFGSLLLTSIPALGTLVLLHDLSYTKVTLKLYYDLS